VPAGNVIEVFACDLTSGDIIGGKDVVFIGGTDIGATVSSGGTEIVSPAGTATDPTVITRHVHRILRRHRRCAGRRQRFRYAYRFRYRYRKYGRAGDRKPDGGNRRR